MNTKSIKMDKVNINKLLTNKTEFFDILKDNIEDYGGKYSEIIIHGPKIYKLLCNLLESKNISSNDRNKICSAIAYFILPKDVFPEEVFGAKGYIDDIYLCLYILREIEKEYELEELFPYWEGDIDLLKKLLKEDYEKIDKDLNYILKEILEYIGLH